LACEWTDRFVVEELDDFPEGGLKRNGSLTNFQSDQHVSEKIGALEVLSLAVRKFIGNAGHWPSTCRPMFNRAVMVGFRAK
jgi:hypothetical protein